MKLRRLAIRRLPGIPGPGFEIDRFDEGVNVVFGPNASGKTSVLRAVRAVLYADEVAGESVHVEADFSTGEDPPHALAVARIGGAATWTRDGERADEPRLPEHRFVSCYTLHLEDLLASDAGNDAEIARRVARELAGGYDLRVARRECGFSVPAQTGRKEARELADADAALRKLQQARSALSREEERLPELEGERRQAEEAGREDAHVERAMRLLETRRERLDLERRRSAFPPGTGRLTGDETGTLQRLRAERREVATRLARAEAEQHAAGRALAESGLAGHRLEQEAIAELRSLLDRLRQLEEGAGRERTHANEAAARRDRATQALGGEPGRGARLDPDTIHCVEQALDASRRKAAEVRGVEAVIADLPHPGAAGERADPNRDSERLREARGELLRWQAAAPSPGLGAGGRATLLLFIAVAGAAGAALGLLVHPAGFGLLAVAAAAAGWLMRGRDAGLPRRREAERRYRRLGVDPPASWEFEAVEARLIEIDAALVDALHRAGETGRRAEAERKREGMQAALGQEREKLARLAVRVNFDPGMLDGSFDRWLRLVEQYERADLALCESRARLAALEREASALRARSCSFLSGYGEAPVAGVSAVEPGGEGSRVAAGGGASAVETLAGETPGAVRSGEEVVRVETVHASAPAGEGNGREGSGTGAPGGTASANEASGAPAAGFAPPVAELLRGRLERLAERLRRRDEARRAIDAAREQREGLAVDLESRDAAIEALFERAGIAPGDEAELRRRLGFLEEWRSLDRRLSEARGAEDLLRGELAGSPELLSEADAGDEPALLRRREALGGRSRRARELAEECARIRTLVDQASRERALEGARAVRQRAQDALRERYEEALLADAGAFLLDRVEEEHVHASRPAVLRRAEDWFARFTRHRFTLEVAPDGDRGGGRGAFRARETMTGERRALSELSSGTRMQLLLAVRIAFALEAEQGCMPLPFFLDEALTTADPERYRAAVEGLRRLAGEEGRQIFYLTAQPDEVACWAAARPKVIDLAERQRTGRAVAHPAEVELPPVPPEPPPAGDRSPPEYAVLIGASPVDPWAAPAGVHLFHLLRDDLDLLRRLLRAGVERLGPLASLLDSDEAGLVLSDAEGLMLRRRAAGAQAWVEAWREGRGRPVDRDALAASGAVSDRFLSQLADLARTLGGDARALLEAIDGGALPRFRADRRRRLEEWLGDHGHLADTEPLDRPGLERRVAAVLSAHGTPSGTRLADAAHLARAMAAGLAGPAEGAPD